MHADSALVLFIPPPTSMMKTLMSLFIAAVATAQPLDRLVSGLTRCCPAQRTVNTDGSGTVRMAPDQAIVRFHVLTVGDTPQNTRLANDRATANILSGLAAVGIPPERISTQNLILQPHFVPAVPSDPSKGNIQQGYEATRYVTVDVRNVTAVPQVVAVITEAGSGQPGSEVFIDSVTYGLTDTARANAENEALALAVKAALRKARTIARSLGDTLGPAINVNEGGGAVPAPLMLRAAAPVMDTAAGSTAVPEAYTPEGEIAVTKSVSATFELVGSGPGDY